MPVTLRQARVGDIRAMHRVRLAVRENRLVSRVTEADYAPAITHAGRGWLVEEDGVIVGFAIGNARTGGIWALFVDPAHERRGHGRRLHDAMVAWLFGQGCERLSLSTEPGTRAQRFYEAAGWVRTGAGPGGEVRYELRPRAGSPVMRRLAPSDVAAAAPQLAALFVDAVADNASIGFMADLSLAEADAWWRAVAARPQERIVLVVEDGDGIAGVAILVPMRAAFQPHRAEIAKVVVHRRARGRGYAAALMRAAEDEARALGRDVLTLMTRCGSDGERLYRRLGWTEVGFIPQDSLAPDGTLVDGAIFVKRLG